jgi:hypothetical protein
MGSRGNAFLDLIGNGKIRTIPGLKSAFRAAVKKAHPDASGAPEPSSAAESSETFIRLRADYEEALSILETRILSSKTVPGSRKTAGGPENVHLHDFPGTHANPRNNFYLRLYLMERSSPPFWFQRGDPKGRYDSAWEELGAALEGWKPEIAPLLPQAKEEYGAFIAKRSRRTELFSLRNLFFNIASYHFSGKEYYARRAEAELKSNLGLLRESGSESLRVFFEFLIEDLSRGPAIPDEVFS